VELDRRSAATSRNEHDALPACTAVHVPSTTLVSDVGDELQSYARVNIEI